MYMPRRGRRRGLNLALMGLMMGASLLLPMVTGQGSNPLEMFSGLLGGKKGGEEKAPEATATSTSSAARTTSRGSSSSRGGVTLQVPRITAQRPASSGPSAPVRSSSTPTSSRPASAPAAPTASAAPATSSAPAPAPRVAAATAAPSQHVDLVGLKLSRDTAYTELRAALESGDPQRVQAASVVYSIAEREYREAR